LLILRLPQALALTRWMYCPDWIETFLYKCLKLYASLELCAHLYF
jgi:hypothetical protein